MTVCLLLPQQGLDPHTRSTGGVAFSQLRLPVPCCPRGLRDSGNELSFFTEQCWRLMAEALLNILVQVGLYVNHGRRVYPEQHVPQFPSTRYHVIATAGRSRAAVSNVHDRGTACAGTVGDSCRWKRRLPGSPSGTALCFSFTLAHESILTPAKVRPSCKNEMARNLSQPRAR
jgi:hypothetical protein